MLALTRKKGQSLYVGDIRITRRKRRTQHPRASGASPDGAGGTSNPNGGCPKKLPALAGRVVTVAFDRATSFASGASPDGAGGTSNPNGGCPKKLSALAGRVVT